LASSRVLAEKEVYAVPASCLEARQNGCHSFCAARLIRRPPARAPQLRGACSAAGKSSSVAETAQQIES
jgi:hypothetical protein